METLIPLIETLFEEKTDAYKQLVDILTQERKSLENADVDAMWVFSDRKQKISARITALRKEILHQLDQAGIHHGMNPVTFHMPSILARLPGQQTRRLQKQYAALVAVKNNLNLLSRENKTFVEDYLGILDELIGIITNAGKPEPVYDQQRYGGNRPKTNMLLHREV